MNNPETPQSTREQRQRELQQLDSTLTPEFWEGVQHDADNHWLEVRGLTLAEYEMLLYGDDE